MCVFYCLTELPCCGSWLQPSSPQDLTYTPWPVTFFASKWDNYGYKDLEGHVWGSRLGWEHWKLRASCMLGVLDPTLESSGIGQQLLIRIFQTVFSLTIISHVCFWVLVFNSSPCITSSHGTITLKCMSPLLFIHPGQLPSALWRQSGSCKQVCYPFVVGSCCAVWIAQTCDADYNVEHNAVAGVNEQRPCPRVWDSCHQSSD